ncbi:LysR family transcriptional regulator [Flavobacterium sp.]|uniref:LysR family transcriptional regulator n=1 Tax=Flavobacterium sp. TaxID=239 RepID=UPI00260FE676|nr:LysR family transcriptional regulator [Flavobacterium sp.]MDD3003466.1 LysR family transcriptional regulator [Flavobacterium sp.]
MNYTLNQLEIFLRVAENESVTKAAEILNLTQPAVSIQLKNFQAQFDIPLTEISGRKIYITDFGKEIANAAANILNQVHAINYKTAAFKNQLTGRLKISVVSTGIYVMPYFLNDFLKLHPHVELILDVTNKRTVIENLKQNEVDFSLVSILPQHMEVEKMDLLLNKLYLVNGQSIENSSNITADELFENLTLLLREEGSGTRQVMEEYIFRNQINFSKKLQLTSNEAVKQAIVAGIGSSILPLIGLKNELLNNDLQIIPVKNLPIKTMWSLIWLKNKKHSPVAMAYLRFLEQHKENIIKERFGWYSNY